MICSSKDMGITGSRDIIMIKFLLSFCFEAAIFENPSAGVDASTASREKTEFRALKTH